MDYFFNSDIVVTFYQPGKAPVIVTYQNEEPILNVSIPPIENRWMMITVKPQT